MRKKWVRVLLKRYRLPDGRHPEFVPSFEDIYRMVRAIGFCEDVKYPDGKGRKMVREFLDHCADCPDFEFLRREFKIPDRGYRSETKLDVRIEDMEFENDEDAA